MKSRDSELINVRTTSLAVVCPLPPGTDRQAAQFCFAYVPVGSRTVKTEPLPGWLATVTSPPIMWASLRVMARPSPVPPNRWAVVASARVNSSPAAPASCRCRCRPLLSRCLMSVGQASRLDMWASFRAMARPRTTKRLIPFSRESISRESHSESFSQGHKWNPQRFRRADQTPPST
jgi:hypothetical protein